MQQETRLIAMHSSVKTMRRLDLLIFLFVLYSWPERAVIDAVIDSFCFIEGASASSESASDDAEDRETNPLRRWRTNTSSKHITQG